MAVVHGGDGLAVGRELEMADLRAGEKLDVPVLKRCRQRDALGVHLAQAGVRERVPAGLAALQPGLDVDAERQRRRMKAEAFQLLTSTGNRRLVGHRREGVGNGMVRLGRVLAQRAANLEELLGLGIPGLELVIGDRPRRRDAAEMLHLGKVFLAVADEHRAVEFRVAADIIIIAGVEEPAAGLAPHLLRAEMAAPEDGGGVARLGRGLKPLAAFEDEDFRAAAGKAGGDGRAADAGADDDDVWLKSID